MILTTTGTQPTVTIVGLRALDNNDLVLTHPQTLNLLDFYDSEDVANSAVAIQVEIDAGTITATDTNLDPITDAVAATEPTVNYADVARSGEYSDLLNPPAFGTAAFNNTGDFATAAQGATADTAVQPGDNVSDLVNDALYAPTNVANTFTANQTFADTGAPDSSTNIETELHVGTFANPQESCFGGGDSHVETFAVFLNTNGEIGTWTDRTSDFNSVSGAGTPIFNSTAVGEAIYVGADYEFTGLKSLCTLALNLGAGSVAQEYWDGAAWQPFIIMATDADAPYAQYGQAALARVNSEQIRFGARPGWATKNLNGTPKFWLRYIITSPITTIAEVDQFKLHTSRTEINKDGFEEFFGAAEPMRDLQVHQRLSDDLAGASPGNGTVNITTNIDLTLLDNALQDGAVDGFGQLVRIPEGLDTSREVTFTVGFNPTNNNSGNIELEFFYSIAQDGDILNGSLPELTQSNIFAVSGVDDQLSFTSFSFELPDSVPGDLLGFSLLRNAGAGNADDTYAGNIEIVFIRLTGTFWR